MIQILIITELIADDINAPIKAEIEKWSNDRIAKSDDDIDDLVIQICYRAADLG